MKRGAAVFFLVLMILLAGCNSTDYKKAGQLFNGGAYERAMTIYQKLGDYKDSAREADGITADMRHRKEYEEAEAENEKLQDALRCVSKAFAVGDTVTHVKFGKGTVKSIEGLIMVANFPAKEVRGNIPIMIANGLLKCEKEDYSEEMDACRDVLKKYDTIPRRLEYAKKALEPYASYLE